MKTSLLRGLAGLAILALGVFVMNGLIGLKTPPPVMPRPANARLVKVAPASPDTLTPRVSIEGRVQALNRMTVLSEVNGMVPVGGKEFREGVRFAAGEAMLRVDDSELRATLVSQRSQWLQLLAGSLADVQVDFPERADVWRTYVQKLNVEAPLTALPEPATDRERLYLTSRGIVSGFHGIRASEERLEKFTLRAPFEGVVTNALVEPGSMVRAGQPLGVLVGTGTFEVKSAVHARHLALLAPGNDATLGQEDGRVVATGRLSRISGNVDPATQSASVYCTMTAAEGMTLRDGRFLSGTVEGAAQTGVVELPEALLEGPDDDQVFLVQDDKLVLHPVTVVHRDADRVLVAGLQAGMPLLAEPVSGAYEGMLVEVLNR